MVLPIFFAANFPNNSTLSINIYLPNALKLSYALHLQAISTYRMRLGLITTLLCALFCVGFSTSTEAAVDKLRLIIRSDPSNSMTIGWNQVSGDNPKVFYGFGRGLNRPAETEVEVTRAVKHMGMNNHFVRLTDLKPNSEYFFRIKDSEGSSKTYWFVTLPDSPDEKLSLISGGDSRTFREPRRKGNVMVAKIRPHAVIFAGDMIAHSVDQEWQDWLDDWQSTISVDRRMTPIIAARGNHEKKNKDIHRLFDVPSKRVYYQISLGNSLMSLYTLNTEIGKGGRQKSWLKKSLVANQDAIWHVAQYHRPVRPHIARKPEGKGQYKHWVPLFEEYGVKLAIECDSHTHKITWPIKSSQDEGNVEGFVRDEDGIVYVGEGCWGAPLQTNDDDKTWTRGSGRVNQVKWMIVSKEQIEIRTVKIDNANEVESVTEKDRFKTPKGVELIIPKDGKPVIIKN